MCVRSSLSDWRGIAITMQGAVKISCARQDPNARNCHGYRKFVKRSVLESPQNGYMANDTIVIRYTIELVVSSGGALSGHKAPGNLAKPSVIQVRQLPHRLSHACHWRKLGVAFGASYIIFVACNLPCYSLPFPAHVQVVSIYCPGAPDWTEYQMLILICSLHALKFKLCQRHMHSV